MLDPPETPLKRLLFLPHPHPPVPLVHPCCWMRAGGVRGVSRVPFRMCPGGVREMREEGTEGVNGERSVGGALVDI